MTVTIFTAPTMECGGCAASIKRSLKNMPGVIDADVDLQTKKVKVNYDPVQTNVQAVKDRIEAAGFAVANVE